VDKDSVEAPNETSAMVAQKAAASQSGLLSRVVCKTGNAVKSGLAVIGLGASVIAYLEYKQISPDKDADKLKDGDKSKASDSRVLVIPFHRMELVEQKESTFRGLFSRFDNKETSETSQYEVRELVDVLHHAASDPTITAVYGIFGHGGQGIEAAGWAQLEEIRHALQVIKESHRRHAEPNVAHRPPAEVSVPVVPHKPLYAYADSFASFASPSNKDYYLASIFTHIHLQEKGELNLFGMITQQFFIRGFLEKYGIQLHVFKHGPYKNAPNMFTEQTFNKFHKENVMNVLTSIDKDVCDEITSSRFKALSAASWVLTSKTKKPHHKDHESIYKDMVSSLWKRIRDSGTFSGEGAAKAGLVDFLPTRDPLLDLVKYNGDKATSRSEGNDEASIGFSMGPHETNAERFPSERSVTLKDYARQIAKEKRSSWLHEKWHAYGDNRWSSVLGVTHRKEPEEKIALLQVNGSIGDAMASRLVDSIRKIRDDDKTKCVVLRVCSPGGSIQACETIKQELKALNLPVVVSFGNVSASGGYYISAAADRIFGSKKSISGSIGVFGIRMDLTGLAAKYGINVEHVAAGEFSGSYMPFHPMSPKMKKNMSEQIDRYYAQFKQVVADGRGIPLDKVEAMAQGRVWTGDQAKSNGLIDEIGGLHRALAYARRTYTTNSEDDSYSDVVVWPKKKTLFDKLKEVRDSNDAGQMVAVLCDLVAAKDGISVASQGRLDCGIAGCGIELTEQSLVSGHLSGFMMTADENTAIRCLLEESRGNRSSIIGEFS
jgi:protease IV